MFTLTIVLNSLLLLATLSIILPAHIAGRIIYLGRFNKKCYQNGLPLPTDPQWKEAYNDKQKATYILYTFEVWKKTKFWHILKSGYPIFKNAFDMYFFEETYGHLVHKNVKRRELESITKTIRNGPPKRSAVDILSDPMEIPTWIN